MFNHLHVHTEYSLLDGVSKVKKLINKAKDIGYEALAITDHGNLYGSFDFWSNCNEVGIKPIIGSEMYLAPRSYHDKVYKIDDKPYHLTILAKNQEGFKNLIKLISISHLDGFYKYPRIDKDLLKKYSKGLIVLSGCMSGIISKNLIQDNYEQAKAEAEFLREIFGKDFYLEIMRIGKEDSDEILKKTVELAKETKIPLVATADVHYIDKEDWNIQEVIWAIADGKTLKDPHRRKSWSKEFYLKSPKEMEELFADIPEAIKNTQKIVDSIEIVNMDYGRVQPFFPDIPPKKTAKQLLKELTYKGAKKRYKKIDKALKERIDFELKVISDKGYDHYFLVVWDIYRWIRENDLVASCRGSVASSVVAYCLQMTHIEPIKWELYFERFLNPERPSAPDIDLDLQDDLRDKVIEYVTNKYGVNNIAAICTFGKLQTRAAIRDVARVMDVDLSIADKLSKMVKVLFGKVKDIDFMMQNDEEFKRLVDSDKRLRQLTEIVKKIDGNPRHISVHACGYLITPDDITNYVPLRRESRGGSRIITQIEGPYLESMGMMKFDFLGLANLTIIKNTIKKVRENKDPDFSTEKMSFDDEATYKLYSDGNTHGIFQSESGGMIKYLRSLQPKNIEDICFMLAAYRPGAMNYISDYINRKYGREEVTYLLPELEPIIGNTFGIIVYQEQIIRIAVDIAGYTMGQADKFRKAMGKKKKDVLEVEKPEFVKGVIRNGFTKEIAEKLWNFILPFADYGFNKAHSASYAVVSFWTAYLKAHYPLEFMSSLLEHHLQNFDDVKGDITECERMKIKILPPDINKSEVNFKIEGKNAIRLGLAAVKNVGLKPCQIILEARNETKKGFTDFDDFLSKVDLASIGKKTIEYLIKVGALDSFGDRGALYQVLSDSYDTHLKFLKEKAKGQKALFAETDKGFSSLKTPIPAGYETTDSQKLLWEKELIGVYITKHPIKEIQEFINIIKAKDPGDITKENAGDVVKIVGILNKIKRTVTKNGNKPMAILEIEGILGQLSGVIFPIVYESQGKTLEEGALVYIKGEINERDDKPSIIVNEIKPINIDKAISFAKKYKSEKVPQPK